MIGEWPAQEVPKELQCPFNAWVKCPEKNNCQKCGWNPVVEKERLELKYGIRTVE